MVNRTGYPDRPAFDAFIKKYRPAGLPKMPEATPAGQAPGGRRASIAGRRSAAEHQNESILRVKDLCKRQGRVCVDVRAALPLCAENFDDAVHPTPAGSTKIAQAVHSAMRAYFM